MFSLPRLSLAALFAASILLVPALAQIQAQEAKPADGKGGDKPAQTQPDADAQRRVDEFAEAARQVSGPAGNAECVWLGRRVVGLLYRDDMDTAFRHLDLYDRFGCPGPHIQSAFRCVVRQGASIDQKKPETLNARVHTCWLNPGSGTATAAATAPGAASAAAAPAATQGAAPAPATPPMPPSAKPPGTSNR
ncbi:MAG: beta-1-3, beta-1-6-glucan biosynthesis protein [Xanthobacteraceae bacterium]|nr:beta-1-3, beta-1-6-glucan biosynthesis protein [Xanthobacteraceae bacterium]